MNDVTQARLDDQIAWYDRKSRYSQRLYKTLKFATVALAAVVPLAAALKASAWVTGALGVLIILVEAVQQMNQYHHNWISYRATCEALRHEKYLFAATAGPYASAEVPVRLLAERIESLVSQEHAKWVDTQEQMSKSESQEKGSRP
jgi:Protein of unknown function (DUF4231)